MAQRRFCEEMAKAMKFKFPIGIGARQPNRTHRLVLGVWISSTGDYTICGDLFGTRCWIEYDDGDGVASDPIESKRLCKPPTQTQQNKQRAFLRRLMDEGKLEQR